MAGPSAPESREKDSGLLLSREQFFKYQSPTEMARPIWKGHISFGLVNIPVTLYSAESRSDLHFKLVDRRDNGAIRYEKVNDITGEEVPWDEIVKAYEHDKGEFVLLTDEDFKRAAPTATEAVEIEDFVPQQDIDPEFFDKPYYLIPTKAGQKSYALLRETMRKMQRVAIARVIIRTREYIAALMVRQNALVLNLLRYQQELREVPKEGISDVELSPKELQMAEQLVQSMSGKWAPESYVDEYRKSLMTYIEEKLQKGSTASVGQVEEDSEGGGDSKTIDIVSLLKSSLAKRAKAKEKPAVSKAAVAKNPPKKTRAKKAG